MLEIWKVIPNCPDYMISNIGRVMSCRSDSRRILRLFLCGRIGNYYKSVSLPANGSYKRKFVHCLVAEAFLGIKPEGMDTSHINENKFDNRIENLCYETKSSNHRRPIARQNKSAGHKIGTSGFRGVCKYKNKWRAKITIYGKSCRLGAFNTAREAAEVYDKAAIKEFGNNTIVTNKYKGLL